MKQRRLLRHRPAWTKLVRRHALTLEQLEARLNPSLTIPLDPTLDQFGDQVVTV
jgi:hypothetical protein